MQDDHLTETFHPLPERKKILILGHKQHGKDSAAEIIAEYTRREGNPYTFISSSEYCAENVVFPVLENKYRTWQECFANKDADRPVWYESIKAYNTPDKTRLAREITAISDMYVGMRNHEELAACKEAGIFDHYIWIDAAGRKPPESITSCTVEYDPTYMHLILNDLGKKEFVSAVEAVARNLALV